MNYPDNSIKRPGRLFAFGSLMEGAIGEGALIFVII